MEPPETAGADLTAARYEALGRLARGLAHEINSPTQYLGDNANFMRGAWQDLAPLLDLLSAWLSRGDQAAWTGDELQALRAAAQAADLDYLRDEVPTALAQSADGARTIARIVEAMSGFAGERERRHTRIDLRPLLDRVVLVARNAWKYTAEIAVDDDGAPALVEGDAGDLHLAFLHVLLDAAEAMAASRGTRIEARGRIAIHLRRSADQLTIRITDSGPARSPDLPVARQVFIAHGGTLRLETGSATAAAGGHACVIDLPASFADPQ